MTQFTYTTNVPVPANDPALDVNNMQENTNSVFDIWEEDHTGFNVDPGGKHLQVTFQEHTAHAVTNNTDVSILHSALAPVSGKSDLYFVNDVATIQACPIKAWGSFISTTTADDDPTLLSSSNVVSVTKATNVYTVTFTTGAIQGVNVGIHVTISGSAGVNNITYTADTLQFTTASAGRFTTFSILQN